MLSLDEISPLRYAPVEMTYCGHNDTIITSLVRDFSTAVEMTYCGHNDTIITALVRDFSTTLRFGRNDEVGIVKTKFVGRAFC